MKTESLRINQLSPEAYEWYLAYLEAIDTKNLAAYGALLADSCTMITNNGPAVVGKEAILHALAQYWQSFGSLEHDLLNIYGSDAAFMLEALNHYVRHDGVAVMLRAVALTDRDASGLAMAVRLYTDVTPLFS